LLKKQGPLENLKDLRRPARDERGQRGRSHQGRRRVVEGKRREDTVYAIEKGKHKGHELKCPPAREEGGRGDLLKINKEENCGETVRRNPLRSVEK